MRSFPVSDLHPRPSQPSKIVAFVGFRVEQASAMVKSEKGKYPKSRRCGGRCGGGEEFGNELRVLIEATAVTNGTRSVRGPYAVANKAPKMAVLQNYFLYGQYVARMRTVLGPAVQYSHFPPNKVTVRPEAVRTPAVSDAVRCLFQLH